MVDILYSLTTENHNTLKSIYNKLFNWLRELEKNNCDNYDFCLFDRAVRIDNWVFGQVGEYAYFIYKDHSFIAINSADKYNFLKVRGSLQDINEIKSKLEQLAEIKFEEVKTD